LFDEVQWPGVARQSSRQNRRRKARSHKGCIIILSDEGGIQPCRPAVKGAGAVDLVDLVSALQNLHESGALPV